MRARTVGSRWRGRRRGALLRLLAVASLAALVVLTLGVPPGTTGPAVAASAPVVSIPAGQTFAAGPSWLALAPITVRETSPGQFRDGAYRLAVEESEAGLDAADPPGTAFDARLRATQGGASLSAPIATVADQGLGGSLITFSVRGPHPPANHAFTLSGLRVRAQAAQPLRVYLTEIAGTTLCPTAQTLAGCGIIADHTIDPRQPAIRISGYDRYTTAALAADWGNLQATLVAGDGTGVDALSAVHLAHVAADAADTATMKDHTKPFVQTQPGPVLLTRRSDVPDPTLLALRTMGWSTTDPAANAGHTLWVLGGEDVVAPSVIAQVQAAFPGVVVHRVAGTDRYSTAAATAVMDAATVPVGTSLSTDSSRLLPTAMMASGASTADALAAAPFGAAFPLLLTRPDGLPDVTRSALTQLHVARVVLVGGDGAVTPAVVEQLQAMGIDVVRAGGANRYETSTALLRLAEGDEASIPGGLRQVSGNESVLVDGRSFADALSVAGRTGAAGVMLLTDPSGLSPATAAFLRAHPQHVIAIGGPDVLPQAVLDQAAAAGGVS